MAAAGKGQRSRLRRSGSSERALAQANQPRTKRLFKHLLPATSFPARIAHTYPMLWLKSAVELLSLNGRQAAWRVKRGHIRSGPGTIFISVEPFRPTRRSTVEVDLAFVLSTALDDISIAKVRATRDCAAYSVGIRQVVSIRRR